MRTHWLIQTVKTAIERGYRVNLLTVGWRIRIYNARGETKFTYNLDDYAEWIQEDVVDLVFPYID